MRRPVSVDFHGRLTHIELEGWEPAYLGLNGTVLRHKGYSSVAAPGKEAVVGGWMLR